VWWTEAGGWHQLRVAGAGAFAIRNDGAAIIVDGDGADPAAVLEGLLGPALALGLVHHGVFVLHAGAVALDGGRVVGLIGDSGCGKSTLVALLGAGGHAVPIADDLLAVENGPTGPEALSCYPQLKLGEQAVAAQATLPERLPLAALGALVPLPSGNPSWRRLSGGEAVAQVLGHTVASMLFPPHLLALHLDAAAQLATSLPVGLLSVPHRLDVAAEVLETLREVA
jgi:hypothetical protein